MPQQPHSAELLIGSFCLPFSARVLTSSLVSQLQPRLVERSVSSPSGCHSKDGTRTTASDIGRGERDEGQHVYTVQSSRTEFGPADDMKRARYDPYRQSFHVLSMSGGSCSDKRILVIACGLIAEAIQPGRQCSWYLHEANGRMFRPSIALPRFPVRTVKAVRECAGRKKSVTSRTWLAVLALPSTASGAAQRVSRQWVPGGWARGGGAPAPVRADATSAPGRRFC